MNSHNMEDALFLIYKLRKIKIFSEYVLIDRNPLLYTDSTRQKHIQEGIGSDQRAVPIKINSI